MSGKNKSENASWRSDELLAQELVDAVSSLNSAIEAAAAAGLVVELEVLEGQTIGRAASSAFVIATVSKAFLRA